MIPNMDKVQYDVLEKGEAICIASFLRCNKCEV